MSENLDHEIGGTYAYDDIMTVQSSNTKFIATQTVAPSARYDGQIFVDLSIGPPLVNVYDDTNTQDMEFTTRTYDADDAPPPQYGNRLCNGAMSITYDSVSGVTYLFMLAKNNLVWYGVSDA